MAPRCRRLSGGEWANLEEIKPQDIDFLSPEVITCPFDANRVLRKHSPVYLVPETNMYYVSSYQLIKEAMRRSEEFSNRFMDDIEGNIAEDREIQAIISAGGGWPERDALLTNDPPAHARFRNLVNTAFSKKRVEILAPDIEMFAEQLIGSFADAGSCEFVREFAAPMPLKVIAKLLALEDQSLETLRSWSEAFTDRLSGMVSRARLLECTEIILQYQRFMSGRIESYREEPQDNLVSDLVHAKVGAERGLDMPELLTICHELLVAGNETTVNALSGGMLLLITNPKELEKVIEDRSLIPNMVEEILRCTTPVQSMLRIATRDSVLGGVKIPKGAKLMLRYISANRDTEVFNDAESFKIDRNDANRHLAFGQGGRHVCIGIMLARRELTIAFERILERLTMFKLNIDEFDLEYHPSMLLRGIKELPISFKKTDRRSDP